MKSFGPLPHGQVERKYIQLLVTSTLQWNYCYTKYLPMREIRDTNKHGWRGADKKKKARQERENKSEGRQLWTCHYASKRKKKMRNPRYE
jgi:hypothetical protein